MSEMHLLYLLVCLRPDLSEEPVNMQAESMHSAAEEAAAAGQLAGQVRCIPHKRRTQKEACICHIDNVHRPSTLQHE